MPTLPKQFLHTYFSLSCFVCVLAVLIKRSSFYFYFILSVLSFLNALRRHDGSRWHLEVEIKEKKNPAWKFKPTNPTWLQPYPRVLQAKRAVSHHAFGMRPPPPQCFSRLPSFSSEPQWRNSPSSLLFCRHICLHQYSCLLRLPAVATLQAHVLPPARRWSALKKGSGDTFH